VKNLLYVEDEKELQSFLVESLDSLPINIHLAHDAESAIELISKVSFDIIVLDLYYTEQGTVEDIFFNIVESKGNLCTEIFLISGFLYEKKQMLDDFFYLLNPKNIFQKPQGFKDLLTILHSRIEENKVSVNLTWY